MKKFYSILGLSLLSIQALAQTPQANHRDGESVEYCRQHVLHNQLMADPAYAAQYNAAQAQLAAKEQQLNSAGPTRGTIYKIPVVFHVLHLGGEENISREQILNALFILNRDYRLQNADANMVHPDFQEDNGATCYPADAEIEFVLATKAPNGACFSGITRTYTTATNDEPGGSSGGQAQVNAMIAGNDVYQGVWSASKYLNVFICKAVDGAAGYTFNPMGNQNNAQGMFYNSIFILHNYVGSIGTSNVGSSRALTHEVGHWLNLSHTWGDDNNPGVACGSDHVTDTPETRGVTSCNLNENFCGPRANVENYMDYSYCSKMFSQGQVSRMRAALLSSVSDRNNIWTAANLTAVGADGTAGLCHAEFISDKKFVCAGEQVSFSDQSYNEATGWSWTFTGGSPSSSTAQNPVVTYTTPGTYQVVLTATDGSSSNTETKSSYITVFPAAAQLPFYEGFENMTSLTTPWIVNNPGGPGWELTSTTGATGTKSVKLANHGQQEDAIDELISYPVDLSDVTDADGVTLSFRYAYRKRTSTSSDYLRVYLSDDCGDGWSVRKTMSASQLSGTVVSSAWTPAASDFVTVHMTNVTSAFWNDHFQFKFQFESGDGNNIYLDDINIYEGDPSNTIVLGVNEADNLENAVVFPNPADDEVNVRFSSKGGQAVTLQITDLMGNVLQQQLIQAEEGSNLVLLTTRDLASGMYMVRLNGGAKALSFVVR
jgi:PKD repeat protein